MFKHVSFTFLLKERIRILGNLLKYMTFGVISPIFFFYGCYEPNFEKEMAGNKLIIKGTIDSFEDFTNPFKIFEES